MYSSQVSQIQYLWVHESEMFYRSPSKEEIEHNLRRFPMSPRTEKDHMNLMEQIEKIMHPKGRRYLTVFRVNSELNLNQTIWHAIFKGKCTSYRLCLHLLFSNSTFC